MAVAPHQTKNSFVLVVLTRVPLQSAIITGSKIKRHTCKNIIGLVLMKKIFHRKREREQYKLCQVWRMLQNVDRCCLVLTTHSTAICLLTAPKQVAFFAF